MRRVRAAHAWNGAIWKAIVHTNQSSLLFLTIAASQILQRDSWDYHNHRFSSIVVQRWEQCIRPAEQILQCYLVSVLSTVRNRGDSRARIQWWQLRKVNRPWPGPG